MQQVLPRATFNGRYAVRPYRSLSGGMGDAASTARAAQAVGGAATPVIASILATHAASTAAAAGIGGAGSILGLSASVAVPIIGAALLGATILITSLIKNSGCGQTCVITSQWANQAADALQQNLDAYRALPAPRTKAQQGVALANFDAIWSALKQQCGQPGTGDAGVRCISDRQQGACKWKNGNDCWNWFIGYRDPIANDQTIDVPPPADAVQAAAGEVSGVFSGLSSLTGGISPLLLLGGGLLAFALFGGESKS